MRIDNSKQTRANASIATEATWRQQQQLFMSRLDEHQRRWYLALESKRIGWGGDSQIRAQTGVSFDTIRRGRQELDAGLTDCLEGRVRRKGGGRRRIEDCDSDIEKDLAALAEPETGGDPCSEIKWVRSSLTQLASELNAFGHRVGRDTVRRLLKKRAMYCAAASNALPDLRIPTGTANSSTSKPKRTPA